MFLPDMADYDFTDPADVAWYRHDVKMAALWLRLYGEDAPETAEVIPDVGRDRRN